VISGSAYVDSWGQDPSDDTLNSVRVGGIGPTSCGKELRVKIVSRDGQSVLDPLSWTINAQMDPDLDLQAPLAPKSIVAVLIAIEQVVVAPRKLLALRYRGGQRLPRKLLMLGMDLRAA